MRWVLLLCVVLAGCEQSATEPEAECVPTKQDPYACPLDLGDDAVRDTLIPLP